MRHEFDQQVSVTDKRLLIPLKLNGKVVYFLADTGASLSLVDSTQADDLKFGLRNKLSGTITGAGGSTGAVWHVKDLEVEFDGKKIYQFLATDISNVRDSIKKETDYKIAGILGLPQMKELGWIIDVANSKIYYEDEDNL